MPLLPELGMFALLPEPKSRWREFVFGYGTQSAALILLLSLGILRPQLLTRSTGSYRPIALVNTPVPVNHEPAPVRVIQAPRVVAQPNPADTDAGVLGPAHDTGDSRQHVGLNLGIRIEE